MQITQYQQAADLWLQYQEGLQRYLQLKVQDEDTANDLAQEVLMKLYKSCCSEREIRQARSWLFQIAHNVVIDHYRRQARLTPDLPAEQVELSETSVWQEMIPYVEPLLRMLPEKYAEPLRLADIEGLTQPQVAERLGLGLSATKSRVSRARRLLRDQIQECFHLDANSDGELTDFRVKDGCRPLRGVGLKDEAEPTAGCGACDPA